MLHVTIPAVEQFNERTNEFIYSKETQLQLEHSLISISKWESKWRKPFLSKEAKTMEESIDYVRCMTINKNVDPNVYKCISNDIMTEINAYIETDQTATTFTDTSKKGSNEIITSELLYFWMIKYQIPADYDKWHFSRLMALIRICGIKNGPIKKMSKREVMAQNAALNQARRAAANSKG